MTRKGDQSGNPKKYRAKPAARSSDPRYQGLVAPCCGCHPQAHDAEGCLSCKKCKVSEKEASTGLPPRKPTLLKPSRVHKKKHKLTDEDRVKVVALEKESMPTDKSIEKESMPKEKRNGTL